MGTPNWDESQHPRVPAGSSQGGEFTAGGEAGWSEQQSSIDKFRTVAEGELKQLRKKSLTKDLDEKEAASLKIYNTDAAGDINAELRGYVPGIEPESRLSPSMRAGVIKGLDKAIAKSSIPEDITLFRGVDNEGWYEVTKHLSKGDSFVDKGYVSTSVSEDTATFFANIGANSVRFGGVIQYLVPKGTHALPIPRRLTTHDEAEVLLPRGTKYHVRSLSQEPNRMVLEVR